MPTSEHSARVTNELVDFAWSQWAQLGVSAVASRRDDWAMDPEALLLFSLDLGRHEPRLFDESLDWLCVNGRFLSLQRLRNLASAWSMSQHMIDAATAWAAHYNPKLPWARQQRVHPPADAATYPEDLFPSLQVLAPDPIFLAYGYRRPIAQPSGKSLPPDLRAPLAFSLRLRQLFGIGARAEVVRILLTMPHPDAATPDVAEVAGFAKRNVSEALDALVAAGVASQRSRGRQHVYRLERDRWLSLLELSAPPEYLDWPRLLHLLLELQHWLEVDAQEERSDYMRASAARDFVDRVGPLLEAFNLKPTGLAVGPDYWPVFVQMIDSILAKLALTSPPS